MLAILNYNKSKGVFIIEVLIAVAIITIALVSLLSLAAFSLKISSLLEKTIQANNLAQEAIEAVRSFRDGTDWDVDGLANFGTGDYHLELDTVSDPAEWTLSLGTETINNFTRKIVFEKVSRNSSTNNIEDPYNPGNDDPDTRKIIVNVSWEDKEVEIITYLTNWK